jgi:hypothetical protein
MKLVIPRSRTWEGQDVVPGTGLNRSWPKVVRFELFASQVDLGPTFQLVPIVGGSLDLRPKELTTKQILYNERCHCALTPGGAAGRPDVRVRRRLSRPCVLERFAESVYVGSKVPGIESTRSNDPGLCHRIPILEEASDTPPCILAGGLGEARSPFALGLAHSRSARRLSHLVSDLRNSYRNVVFT